MGDLDGDARRPTLAKLLRGLRSRRGWTLKEMSERTGLSVSTLSKVEHGRLALSYEKLLRMCENLDMGMADLFTAESPERAATGRRSIARLGEAAWVKSGDDDHLPLCTDLLDKKMIPRVERIRSRRAGDAGGGAAYPGEEFFYVLSGKVEVRTQFYDPVVLEAGEAIYLDAGMTHSYSAAEGCEEAAGLRIGTATDEDAAAKPGAWRSRAPRPRP